MNKILTAINLLIIGFFTGFLYGIYLDEKSKQKQASNETETE